MRLVDLMREKLIFGAFLQYYLKSYLRIFSDTFEGINDEVRSHVPCASYRMAPSETG